MDIVQLRNRIRLAINEAYGNPQSPRFHFVAEAMRHPPHGDVVAALVAAGFEVTDTTDANDDVALHLVLRRGAIELPIALSMVGPFARVTPIESTPTWTPEVYRIFRWRGITVIPRHMLDERTVLVLDGEPARIDEALFASA